MALNLTNSVYAPGPYEVRAEDDYEFYETDSSWEWDDVYDRKLYEKDLYSEFSDEEYEYFK